MSVPATNQSFRKAILQSDQIQVRSKVIQRWLRRRDDEIAEIQFGDDRKTLGDTQIENST
jgi:hypothetical protein